MKVVSRSGDDLAYYSQLFQIPRVLIEDANPAITGGVLPNGIEVQIPGYIVQQESRLDIDFAEIALQYHLPIDGIVLLNQDGQKPFSVPVRVMNPVIVTDKPYEYQSLLDDLDVLSCHYPFIKVESVGKSVLGKELLEVRIGQGEKIIHYNGSFHANEWITTAVLMKWLNDFLLAVTNDRTLCGMDCMPYYRDMSISMVPMVNPDGVDLVLKGEEAAEGKVDVLKINNGNPAFYAWKANIRGVDLNNQYPANWEVEKRRKIPKAPAPRDFPGETALSEPEALAMKELAIRRNFERVLALHTQGKEFYWGYEGHEPEHAANVAREFEERSGYRAVKYVDSHAGYKDWFIQEFKRSGFTIELGKGINPLPLSHLPGIYEDSVKILMAGLYM
ncbi:M14 family metallopeptidase [Peribacillus castrilensis]|uniref:M14 family metallopeptidase n=1 Tax=Bacillaceae TaxID=186817 RepID=UPI00066031E4|nr:MULTISPECIES: M14 family metallocarboxypeptidase [Bacillaceae]MBD8587760.1 peptidase M14 [Peribacillus simplex]MCF7623485.1 M14 family metallocarboxypeptidase [Peribacillus frigoritolerans]MEA3573775.1 M14 family metallocarboxypeptidase [Peribacillus frigoritolerans]MEB2629827.1 M14 family metallocarboxypeptidase [Peribacillus frigoritolerans]PRA94342.1 peptidase M14 [Peribacillus simplex]